MSLMSMNKTGLYSFSSSWRFHEDYSSSPKSNAQMNWADGCCSPLMKKYIIRYVFMASVIVAQK